MTDQICKVAQKICFILRRTLQSCALKVRLDVGTLKDGYIHRVTLPRVPQIQSTSDHVAAVTWDSHDTCYSQVPRVPTWSDLTRSLTGFGRRALLPFSFDWLMQTLTD